MKKNTLFIVMLAAMLSFAFNVGNGGLSLGVHAAIAGDHENSNANENSNGNENSNANENSNGNENSNANENSNGNGNSNSNGNSNGNGTPSCTCPPGVSSCTCADGTPGGTGGAATTTSPSSLREVFGQ